MSFRIGRRYYSTKSTLHSGWYVYEYLLKSNLLGADLKRKLKDLQRSRRELEDDVGGLRNLINLADAERSILKFKVVNLFCMGSPLSVYLALRGQKGRSVLDSFQPVIFNIFNANDPVAYRLEPLVHPLYAKVSPLRIHKFDSKNQTPYQEMPMELISAKPALSSNDKNGKKKRDQAMTTAIGSSNKLSNVSDSTTNVSHDAIAAEEHCTTTATEAENRADIPRRSWSAAVLSKFRSSPTPASAKNVSYDSAAAVTEILPNDEGSSTTTKSGMDENLPAVALRSKTIVSECSDGVSRSDETFSVSDKKVEDQATNADLLASLTENEKLPYRVDFVVKAPTLNPLDMVLSHTNYWQKEDIVMFILSQLYGVSPQHGAKM
uniref:DDHD domain-containing protein n=1 Tax=Romanomermis culicivorax TaxID=13658 RepID=A0A915KX12_ROMCU